ncbi:hypothetical protein BDW74DRAFT_157085 [Aspergillus multicolor]|uniref:uncharacterized protein n=1 Tax=Aspergillus multicolor TaxID=41759 RepID=UPI003CCE03DD
MAPCRIVLAFSIISCTVRITLAFVSLAIWQSLASGKDDSIVTKAAPDFSTPRMALGTQRDLSKSRGTQSPTPMPLERRTSATRDEASSSSR